MSLWNWPDIGLHVPREAQISLGEGETPLLKSRRIGPQVGIDHLYFKLETSNPSGSFKDRFAAVAVSHLLAHGKRHCLATSSGNTGAGLATYCAAAGIDCTLVILETTPVGKLTQMLAHGARLVRVHGFGVDPAITEATFDLLQQVGQAEGSPPQISAYLHSPIGMTGVQSISYELAAQTKTLGLEIEHTFVPAGGGGLALAVALGFEQLGKTGHPIPRVECVQPTGNDTIVTPLGSGSTRARAVDCTSLISGLQVSSVLDGDAVIAHCRASGGTGHLVTDEQAWQAQQRLAREEGLFCEPAGAVALAGVLNGVAAAQIDPSATIVCLITGSAFKDPPSLERMNRHCHVPMTEVDQLASVLERGGT